MTILLWIDDDNYLEHHEDGYIVLRHQGDNIDTISNAVVGLAKSIAASDTTVLNELNQLVAKIHESSNDPNRARYSRFLEDNNGNEIPVRVNESKTLVLINLVTYYYIKFTLQLPSKEEPYFNQVQELLTAINRLDKSRPLQNILQTAKAEQEIKHTTSALLSIIADKNKEIALLVNNKVIAFARENQNNGKIAKELKKDAQELILPRRLGVAFDFSKTGKYQIFCTEAFTDSYNVLNAKHEAYTELNKKQAELRQKEKELKIASKDKTLLEEAIGKLREEVVRLDNKYKEYEVLVEKSMVTLKEWQEGIPLSRQEFDFLEHPYVFTTTDHNVFLAHVETLKKQIETFDTSHIVNNIITQLEVKSDKEIKNSATHQSVAPENQSSTASSSLPTNKSANNHQQTKAQSKPTKSERDRWGAFKNVVASIFGIDIRFKGGSELKTENQTSTQKQQNESGIVKYFKNIYRALVTLSKEIFSPQPTSSHVGTLNILTGGKPPHQINKTYDDDSMPLVSSNGDIKLAAADSPIQQAENIQNNAAVPIHDDHQENASTFRSAMGLGGSDS